MLHLQPRVNFQKVECAGVAIDQELDRSRGFIADGLAQPHRRVEESCAHFGGNPRRGRLFNHLLMTPLRGAVAFAQRDHVPVAIAEDLNFDVPRARDEFL